ncbi:MAG: YdeI/OmpD-associated family protein [Candidatus Dormibacteraceae bacterium]
MFDLLNSQNRYAVLYRVGIVKRPDTRARRIEQFVSMLARGETVYPQKRKLGD